MSGREHVRAYILSAFLLRFLSRFVSGNIRQLVRVARDIARLMMIWSRDGTGCRHSRLELSERAKS